MALRVSEGFPRVSSLGPGVSEGFPIAFHLDAKCGSKDNSLGPGVSEGFPNGAKASRRFPKVYLLGPRVSEGFPRVSLLGPRVSEQRLQAEFERG